MSEREREEGVCFGKHWKCGERDAEGVCGALPCLKYIYIYIYIYIYVYSERERWRGERCGVLLLLEVCIYIHTARERERCAVSARNMLERARGSKRRVRCVVIA